MYLCLSVCSVPVVIVALRLAVQVTVALFLLILPLLLTSTLVLFNRRFVCTVRARQNTQESRGWNCFQMIASQMTLQKTK